LNLPRRTVLELLTPPARRPGDDRIARETLGLAPATATLIGTPATGDELWSRYGLTVVGGRATLLDASSGEQVTAAPLALLSRASLLMQQAGVDLGDLRDLLATGFVGAAAVTLTPATECAPSRLILAGLAP